MSDVASASGSAASAAGSSPAPSTAASTPSSQTSTPASASATPSAASMESSAATATPSEPGPVPYARFKEINDQLRTAKQFQEKHGWAEQFHANPYQFVENWIDQLAQHPQYSPQLLAKAARLLQSRRGAERAHEEPAPDVPIMDGQGNLTGHTYSAKQLKAWREWDWAQKQSAFDERLQPLEQMKQVMEQQAVVAQVREQSDQHARSVLGELRQNPFFKEHEGKVKAALMAHEEWGDNIHAAWNHVLTTEILPGLSQSEQRKVVESLQNKANASTVSPSGSAPAGRPKFKNFGEAQRYYQQHPEEAEAMANR